jgi:hypothetical protein
MVLRKIVERPVAGGEKFSVSIGISPRARAALGWLRGLTGASAVLGIGAVVAGGSGGVALGLAGALLAGTLAAEWAFGGSETLVCQGDFLSHRRRRLLRESRRTLPLLDVSRIGPPTGRGRRAETKGLRIETSGEPWTIGPGIAWVEANELAEALERHLKVSRREVLTSGAAKRLDPSRSAPSQTPAQARPETVLRFRNPPPR